MTRRRKDITALLADDITSILDYLSRMLGAAEDGSPHYMHDKARELGYAALRTHRHMSEDPLPEHQLEPGRFDGNQTFNPAKLRELVTEYARHYRAGRALYPTGGDHQTAGRRAALQAAATAIQIDGPEGLDPATANAVASWLLARAEQEGQPS